MDLRARPFRPDDGDRIRRLLRDLLRADPDHPRCWTVLRWDYWVTHGLHNCEWQILEDVVVVWEATDRSIAAVANPEGSGHAFFQVRPESRSAELDRSMLDEMERRMATAEGDRRRLTVWVPDDDDAYRRLLTDAGYSLTDVVDARRVRHLDGPVSETSLADGYRIRSLAPGAADFPDRGLVSLRAFHPGDDEAEAMTAAGYDHVRSGPLYRPDLDLVAEAPDGRIAAFCTVWFDPVTRTADVEPMGTDEPHRRRGLALALLAEGLRRARALGATLAYVGSWNEATHALYGAAGFEAAVRMVGWRRRWS